MKIWITLGLFVGLVAIVGVYFFDKTTPFDFLGYLRPLFTFLENIRSIMRTVFNWFVDLIGWLTPTQTLYV